MCQGTDYGKKRSFKLKLSQSSSAKTLNTKVIFCDFRIPSLVHSFLHIENQINTCIYFQMKHLYKSYFLNCRLNNFRLRATLKIGLDSPHFTVQSRGLFGNLAKIEPIFVCNLYDLNFHLNAAHGSSHRKYELPNIKLIVFWAWEEKISMWQAAHCLSED